MANPSRTKLLEAAANGDKESKYLEFKEQLDPSISGEMIEVIKDIVAITNSGGGVIVIGVKNNGVHSRKPIAAMLNLDPADLTNKIAKYTGEEFAEFEILKVVRRGKSVAALLISPSSVPLVFIKPGTYVSERGKQERAFSVGTVYFRHGAKSEPARSKDLAKFVDRRIELIRRSWLGNIRQMTAMDPGDEVAVIQRVEVANDEKSPGQIRLTNDPGAPVYSIVSHDETHPYRQTELVKKVNEKLGDSLEFAPYDSQAVRAAHGIDAVTNPSFCYKPKFHTQQYSEAFIDWIVDQVQHDSDFVSNARSKYRDIQRKAQKQKNS